MNQKASFNVAISKTIVGYHIFKTNNTFLKYFKLTIVQKYVFYTQPKLYGLRIIT